MIDTILVTGGLGFIGSHTCVELSKIAKNIVIADNLSNSKQCVYEKIKLLSCDLCTFYYYNVDLRCIDLIDNIFSTHCIDLVIHFAGLKSVNQSVEHPLMYYNDNIGMTVNLLNVMNKYNCKKIIFSSSATVYGSPSYFPIDENHIVGRNLLNPYGKTKYFIEEILNDLYVSDPKWSIVILRYFNPVGAHESGSLCEDPNDIPNNLMPYILNVACGKANELFIYGDDYNTPDGTCIRDFIHVVDLATGHIASIKQLENSGIHVYNLGTGKGTSVMTLVNLFVEVNNIDKFKYSIGPRREGDTQITYADVTKAQTELNWKSTKTLRDMCVDAYKAKLNQNI